jgi:putative SOS response-associated peptidase YedK
MTRYYDWDEVHAYYSMFMAAPPTNMEPAYNVAPTQDVLIVKAEPEGNAAHVARWGLVPPWSAEPLKSATFNTRTDTIETSKLWKPSFDKWRCVVPASGWYEWSGEKGAKQAWHFTRPDGELLSFAGLYAPAGKLGKLSCSIIITEACDQTRHIHDRMPVILERDQVAAWLAAPDASLLKPYEGPIQIRAASKLVGNVKNQGPELLVAEEEPASLPLGGFHD